MHKHINLSEKQQLYLEVVHHLSMNHGHAHVRAIAEHLQVSMASVTEIMRKLAEKQLVNYMRRRNITLTEKGKNIALKLASRRRSLVRFLRRIMDCTPEDSETLAGKIIYSVDKNFCHRLDNHIEETLRNRTQCISDYQEI